MVQAQPEPTCAGATCPLLDLGTLHATCQDLDAHYNGDRSPTPPRRQSAPRTVPRPYITHHILARVLSISLCAEGLFSVSCPPCSCSSPPSCRSLVAPSFLHGLPLPLAAAGSKCFPRAIANACPLLTHTQTQLHLQDHDAPKSISGLAAPSPSPRRQPFSKPQPPGNFATTTRLHTRAHTQTQTHTHARTVLRHAAALQHLSLFCTLALFFPHSRANPPAQEAGRRPDIPSDLRRRKLQATLLTLSLLLSLLPFRVHFAPSDRQGNLHKLFKVLSDFHKP